MKKLILIVSLLIPFQSQAGWTDSFWFEPSILCVAGGGAGYATSAKGNEATNAAIGCLVGLGIGYVINTHYEDKFGAQYQKELKDLHATILEFQVQQAQRNLKQEDDNIGIRRRILVPGKKLDDGSVTPPTWRESLDMPGAGLGFSE